MARVDGQYVTSTLVACCGFTYSHYTIMAGMCFSDTDVDIILGGSTTFTGLSTSAYKGMEFRMKCSSTLR